MAQAQSEIRYLTPPSVDVKKKKYCRFKKNGIKYIDYKDPEFLKKFLNEQGKILPRRMQIILKEDILNLGYKDDIVTVKNGYGRNYLIPKGKAIVATESARKVLAENLKQRAHKLAKIKQDAEDLAAKLKDVRLTIETKASSKGKIFGSVTGIQIAESLTKLGFEIDRKIISLKDAVKEVGSYVATVKLHKEVSVEIPFEVVAESAAAAPEEKEKEN